MMEYLSLLAFLLSCLFNDFALKCLLQSTDIHTIDHTFLVLKVIGGGGGGGGGGSCVALTCSELHI